MKKILGLFFIVYSLSCVQVSFADIPKKYVGVWNISHIAQPGFPWWSQIKYPVKLSISLDGARLTDQFEHECSLEKFKYDSELDVFVFSHCGIGEKSKKAFEIMHVVSVDSQGELQGDVRSYKTIFKWRGIRITDKK